MSLFFFVIRLYCGETLYWGALLRKKLYIFAAELGVLSYIVRLCGGKTPVMGGSDAGIAICIHCNNFCARVCAHLRSLVPDRQGWYDFWDPQTPASMLCRTET